MNSYTKIYALGHRALRNILDSDVDVEEKVAEGRVLEEEADEIKTLLFKWAWPHISRRIVNGLPQWYKDRLLAASFPQENAA